MPPVDSARVRSMTDAALSAAPARARTPAAQAFPTSRLCSLRCGAESICMESTRAQARATSSYSERVAKEAGLDPAELRLTGREGSSKGIHTQLKIQSAYQRIMVDRLGYIARGDKMPQKSKQKQGTGGGVGTGIA